MVSTNITALLATYIHALHILHYHGVLDGYGHLSVRNPNNPPTFFMMRQLAPALVSGRDDIGEYRVSDAEPAGPGTPTAPIERFIHSELLKRYPDVNVVLHGHPEQLVSFSISDVPLRAATHLSPFLGEDVPNFDITDYYRPNDTQDFLVRDQRLGAALAAEFDSPSSSCPGNGTQNYTDTDHSAGDGCHDDDETPDTSHHGRDYNDDSNEANDCTNPNEGTYSYPCQNVVLMRSHGFTAVATSIETTTFEGIYAVTNARIQAEALKMQHAYTGRGVRGDSDIAFLNDRQIRDSWGTEIGTVRKPWALWVREVRVNPLYVNELDP